MRLYLPAVFVIFLNFIASAQTESAKKNQTDSSMIVLLNDQASKLITLEPDSGIYFGELALKIGFRSKHYEHLNESHRIVGWCYYNLQNFAKAKFHLQYALNDSTRNLFERNNIVEALIRASEKTGDYQTAYLNLKYLTQLKDSINQQKHSVAIQQLKDELSEQQLTSAEELKQKEKLWQMTKTHQKQLLIVAILGCAVLLLLKIILFIKMHRNRKKFNEILEEKNISISESNDQNRKLQNEISGYEKLKEQIARDKRDNRVYEIAVDEKQPQQELKKEQQSVIDQYENSSAEKRKELLPKMESFLMIIPTQIQTIEQAFARHDWEMINNTLQTMKPIIHGAGLNQTEILINEINEHVNANATNRAVVKLLQVKSACTKTVGAIKNILEAH